MNSSAPTLAGVVERLGTARLRLIAQSVLGAAFGAVIAGLVVFAGLELLRRLLGQAWLGVPVSPQLVAAILAAVILAGGIVAAVLRAPSIVELARRADQTFGLRERISTALEIERNTTSQRPTVVAALLADALRHSEAVSSARLAPFRMPRVALLVPVAAVAAAAVVLLVQPMGGTTGSRLSATLDAGERAALAADISRVTDAITTATGAGDDPHMQAVANTLGDLGQRVSQSAETTREDILDELGALRGYAGAASSDASGAEGDRISRMVAALEEAVAATEMADAAATEAEPFVNAFSEPSVDQTVAGADPAPASTDSLEATIDEPEWRNSFAKAGDMGSRPEILDYIKASEGEATAHPQANKTFDDDETFVTRDGGDGTGSQLAGEGTAAIADGPVAEQLDFETVAEMQLTGTDIGVGDQMGIEITPDTRVTEITDESLAANVDGWRRGTETTAERYAIGIDDRDTVSRYLRALVGPADK